MVSFRFAVGLSFVGSQREYVEEVADILTMYFGKGRVLYDKYYEDEFSRQNLPTYLGTLYSTEVFLNVIFVSSDYAQGGWTGFEKEILLQWTFNANNNDRLMLFNFDRAVLPLFPQGGYIPCENRKALYTAQKIVERYKRQNQGEQEPAETDTNFSFSENNAPVRSSIDMPNSGIFVGRRAEIQKTLEALNPARRSWGCIIVGAGGLGKTALAIRVAESISADIFKKVIFVSAKGHELTPHGIISMPNENIISSATYIYNEIDRQLGASGGKTWSSLAKRSKEILDKLSDQNVLLIIDNIDSLSSQDKEEVFATLNKLPQSCKAIVTSRLAHKVEAMVIELSALPYVDTVRLVEELMPYNSLLANSDEYDREALIAKCGGNPLVLKWIIGQLGMGECDSIKAAISILNTTEEQNDPIMYVFKNMIDGLREIDKEMLAALFVIKRPMTIESIQEIFIADESIIYNALYEIMRRMLVYTNIEETLFWLSPLVDEYVGRMLTREISLQKKLYFAYVDQSFYEYGFQQYDKFLYIDAMWPCIQVFFSYLDELDNSEIQKISISARQYLSFSGYWDEWMHLSISGENKAISENDMERAYVCAYDRGIICFRRGEWNSVVEHASRVSAHAMLCENPQNGLALAYRLISLGLRGMGKLEQAKKFGEISVEMFTKQGRTKDTACALNALGVTLHHMGDLGEASRLCQEALDIAEEVENAEYATDYTGNLADIAYDSGDIPEATKLAKEAHEMANKIGRKELVAKNEFRLAKIAYKNMDLEEASSLAASSIQIYTDLGMPMAEDVKRFIEQI